MSNSSTFLASDGEGYEAQMGRWSRRLAPLLIDFAGLSTADHVLDAGCGTGSLAVALARHPGIGRVTGVDISEAYISFAATHNAAPGLHYEPGDITRLSFGDGAFDHALSSLVLQFVPDPGRAVRELVRVTRRGGLVAAATWDTRGGVVAQRMFLDTAAVLDPEAARYRAFACARAMSRQDGLVATWRACGLAKVTSAHLTIRMDFASFHDFWSSIDGKDGPYAQYLATLGDEKKHTLRGLVEAAYLDGEADGPRSYAATAWAVKGVVP